MLANTARVTDWFKCSPTSMRYRMTPQDHTSAAWPSYFWAVYLDAITSAASRAHVRCCSLAVARLEVPRVSVNVSRQPKTVERPRRVVARDVAHARRHGRCAWGHGPMRTAAGRLKHGADANVTKQEGAHQGRCTPLCRRWIWAPSRRSSAAVSQTEGLSACRQRRLSGSCKYMAARQPELHSTWRRGCCLRLTDMTNTEYRCTYL